MPSVRETFHCVSSLEQCGPEDAARESFAHGLFSANAINEVSAVELLFLAARAVPGSAVQAGVRGFMGRLE